MNNTLTKKIDQVNQGSGLSKNIQTNNQIKYGRSKNATRQKHIADILELKFRRRYVVIEMNGQYQFRIGGKLDIYPTNAKYHHLKSGRRGSFENVAELVKRFL